MSISPRAPWWVKVIYIELMILGFVVKVVIETVKNVLIRFSYEKLFRNRR